MIETSVIGGPIASPAWLEYVPFHGASPERIPLSKFPFTIGRDETADLRLDSTRVSREHAILGFERGSFHVRDNGSTNGTYLNGERLISSEPLRDGDMLRIADIEFSFLCDSADTQPATGTLAMGQPEGEASHRAFVRELRQLQEAITHCCVETHYRPLAETGSGAVVGYSATAPDDAHPTPPHSAWQFVQAADCRLTERLRQIQRITAVQQAAGRLGNARLFIPIASVELGSVGLAESLGRLQAEWPGRQGLVVEIPDPTVTDTRRFRELLQRLRDLHVAVAFTEFAGGPSELAARKGWAPDYLKLARSWVTNLADDPTRQRRMSAIAQTSREIGCAIIATGVDSHDAWVASAEAGCGYAEGLQVGTALPIDLAEQASQPLLA